jgi:pimeloyl-ACP methyl ester carboxylesterase
MMAKIFMVVILCLSVTGLTGRWLTDSCFAGNNERSPDKKVEQDNAQKKLFDAHESYVRYHFKDPDMDFSFGSLILGATINQGSEIGEAFQTAANIKDGDAASWQEEWLKTARLVEARGMESLAKGRKVSARAQLQRASYYYRVALLSMMPEDSRLKETAMKNRSCFKQAAKLFDPPIEYFEIPFEGTVLPGYFRKAAAGPNPRKTLVMIGGGETFAEDLFFYIGPQAFDHGYNFVTVDLPGQGLLPLEGKTFRAAMNIPMKAVTDFVLSRPDVDPRKVVAYGMSGGGGFVPQAAMHDSRIKAVAMNSCVVDAYRLFATMPMFKSTKDEINSWSSFHRNTVELVAWRWGVKRDNLPGMVEANKGFTFDPAKVSVPAMIIVAAGEYKSKEIERQQRECIEKLPNPKKKLVVTPAAEGASNHCIMENRSLMAQVLFDWLDEVLEEAGSK